MIPKIIHYCWFGRGEMPPLAKECIVSWAKYLPEYELRLWNEDNFNLSIYPYAEEAYRERKFAFVTDVCRLFALRNHGGIYMDTDVELLKPLSEALLEKHAFSGFEDNDMVPTGLMASIKDGAWVNDLLNYYEGRSFYLTDGSLDLKPNTEVITEFMRTKGVLGNNTFQELENYCSLYPSDFFCPKSWRTREIVLTDNTYCIHHFAGSWIPEQPYTTLFKLVAAIVGEHNAKELVRLKYKLFI